MRVSTKKKILNHYNGLLENYGFNEKGLGWRKKGLNDRYDVFLKHIFFKNKDILDYGCGLAHFYNFLEKKKIKFKNYNCYDLNEKINIFLEKKYTKKKNFKIIKTSKEIKKFDIIISNGVHNYKTKEIEKNFFKDLEFFLKKSKYAIGISFLNDNVDYKEKYLSYKKISKVIKFLKKKNKLFILDQTFKKYETFLIIFINSKS